VVTVLQRCDNCGCYAVTLYAGPVFAGRIQWLCDPCVHKLARYTAGVERVFRKRAA
jgi:hypothetical protein